MNKAKLKNIVSYILIPSHLIVLGIAFVLYIKGGYSFEEFTTLLLIIVPLYATYTTLIIRYLTKDVPPPTTTTTTTTLNPARTFFTIALPILLTIYFCTIIYLKAYNIGFDSFENFKGLLGVSEVIFGIYVGQFIQSLYDD